MKNKTRGWISLAVLTVALITNAIYQIGCKSTEDTAFKVTGTTVVSLNAAMLAYRDACRAGLIASNEQDHVRDYYNRYHAALLIESNAIVTLKTTGDTNALYQSVRVVTGASADVIGLVEQFLPPDRLLKLKGQTP